MPGQDQSRFPDQSTQRPVFLSGKVMLEDGTAPPEPVTIERVCNGRPIPEGYTDSKGRFSFELGRNQSLMQDAAYGSATDDPFSQSPGLGNQTRASSTRPGMGGASLGGRDLMGCELRAVLPGFRSEVVNLSGRRMFDNPDVGTIILRRLANVEGTTISAVALLAPKDAKKSLDKAREYLKKKKGDEAFKELEKAVQIYPKYSTAWFELGRLHEGQNRKEEARKAYAEALAADPKYVSPYLQMASMAFKEQKWEEVAGTTDRIIKLDPVDYRDAYFYNAVACYYLKKFDAAEKSAREVQKMDPRGQIPMARNLLGAILIEKQDYAGAAEQVKEYLKMIQPGAEADRAKKTLEQLEKALNPQAKAEQ
ncbi:MAG: tetratricopeptide repeat protein [Candidatus Solibacter usitatus]|nr:tetratricopeptide repeat protein [Candidatus Solibacter usitatus]